MAYKPSLSDLLIIKRPYDWLERKLVNDKDSFYRPNRRKIGLAAGAFLYAATAVSGCKMYQNLSEDWRYADLSPTYNLIRYTADRAPEPEKSSTHIWWGLGAAFSFWAGDFALMYAARNRAHNRRREQAVLVDSGLAVPQKTLT